MFGLICFGVIAPLYLFVWCLSVSLICGLIVGYGFVVSWFLWYWLVCGWFVKLLIVNSVDCSEFFYSLCIDCGGWFVCVVFLVLLFGLLVAATLAGLLFVL